MRRSLTALACTAALAGLVGCGESDQEQAREVVQDYVDARSEGDYERVCELFSDDFKRELAVGENCAEFVQEASGDGGGNQELQVIDVRVRDERAIADIDVVRGQEGPSRIGLLLERQDDDWKITGLQ